MLLKQKTLKGIAAGDVSLAFRRWKRPSVKAGGTLTTSIGVLGIDAVEPTALSRITTDDARQAGFEDVASVKKALGTGQGGTLYRVAFHLAGEDPRIALREDVPGGDDIDELVTRLERSDERSDAPWTRDVLVLIGDKPGVRAGDLAAKVDMERARFKIRVRTLKGMGLTESLEVGYRLSPRGKAVLKHLTATAR
jgi:hypothetical protein